MNCTHKVCPILRASFRRCPLTYCPTDYPSGLPLSHEMGSVLRTLRCRKGMTQQEVARRIGTYAAKICQYENGYCGSFPEEKLWQLARAIDGEAGEQAAREMVRAMDRPAPVDFSAWSEGELRAYAERGEMPERCRAR